MLYDLIYRRYLKQSNAYKQKVKWWLTGEGELGVVS